MQEILHEVWQAAMMRLVKKPPQLELPLRESTAFTNPKTELGEKNMKTLKSISAAAILALALSVSTYAGQLETPGYTPPPPPPPQPGIRLELSMPTAPSSDLDDMSSLYIADLLWALASIF
jgi:hypothetical protein